MDAVLGFMGGEPLGPLFECDVEVYLGITGMSTHRLGVGAVGDASPAALAVGGGRMAAAPGFPLRRTRMRVGRRSAHVPGYR